MARIYQDGFELNSLTSNLGGWTTVGTTGASIAAGSARSGSYGLKLASLTSATAAGALYKWAAATAAGPFYLRVYLNVQTRPSASNHIISLNGASGSVGSTARSKITLEADGSLILRNAAGTQIGSASAVLTTNQWYMVEIQHDASKAGATDVLEARLDGSVFATSSAQTLSNIFAYSVGANLDLEAQTTGEWWFDDTAINDNTGSFQTSYPGSGKIIHQLPDSAGDSNGFLVNVGGTAGSSNNYTRVNEVTPDDATSYNASDALNAEDLFNMGASGIGSGDTVNVVMIGGRFANLVSADATAAFKFEVEKTASGTKTQSSAIIPNTTAWNTNGTAVPRNYPIITYQDPDSSAWTQTTLDSMQVGYIESVANIQTIGISTVWASVDYTPSSITTSTSSSVSTSSTSSSISTSSTSSSISTSSTSSSISTSSTSSSVSTSSTSSSRSTSTSSTSSSISTSSTSSSVSTSSTSSSRSTSTSQSISTSASTSSTSSSISTSSSSSSISVSTSSTSSSISTSSTSASTSVSTSSTSKSTSTSSTSSSISVSTSSTSSSISTSSTSTSYSISTSSTSRSISTSSTSSSSSISTSISTSSTSLSVSTTTSTSSTSSSTSSTSTSSTSTSTTIPPIASDFQLRIQIKDKSFGFMIGNSTIHSSTRTKL